MSSGGQVQDELKSSTSPTDETSKDVTAAEDGHPVDLLSNKEPKDEKPIAENGEGKTRTEDSKSTSRVDEAKNGGKSDDGPDEGRAATHTHGGFEIIGIKEKHGQLRKAVPTMPLSVAVVLCIVNVILPGIGTLISAFTVFCGGKTEYDSKGKSFGLNVVAAVLQLLTLPILVGWIWSIIWGVTFVTSAMTRDVSTTKGQPSTTPAPVQV